MKEILKKWLNEKRAVEVICVDRKEAFKGKLVYGDEKLIHIQEQYGMKVIVPWSKIATVKDCSGEIVDSEKLKKLPLIRVCFDGTENSITQGFLEKMDENCGVVTVYHDGVRSIHPMSSIRIISFICEIYED